MSCFTIDIFWPPLPFVSSPETLQSHSAMTSVDGNRLGRNPCTVRWPTKSEFLFNPFNVSTAWVLSMHMCFPAHASGFRRVNPQEFGVQPCEKSVSARNVLRMVHDHLPGGTYQTLVLKPPLCKTPKTKISAVNFTTRQRQNRSGHGSILIGCYQNQECKRGTAKRVARTFRESWSDCGAIFFLSELPLTTRRTARDGWKQEGYQEHVLCSCSARYEFPHRHGRFSARMRWILTTLRPF